ncbi:Putative peptidoglycan binding domain-containing protein [Bacillus wiedmannii]|uniref:Putative peptidoglycan binding domain-containing protein n=1 Tax=Bacillus wiedmannii TaxID=1890302 RepID=A0A1G6V974_9BACI|nr:neuraminidase-like domain-containing protein [Bacillus wiedmannii]SDD50071.1 Putative peptidoglycan binding domain-containing protein [Bacillus wiedmannii]
MNKITFPLQSGKTGPEVGNLQDALQLFLDRGVILAGDEGLRRDLIVLLRAERAVQVYEDVTRKLVSIFQEERQLAVQRLGKVDEITAKEIDARLREFGVLDEDGWMKVVGALHTQDDTLKSINVGTNHLASIDEKLNKAPTLSLNMRGKAVKELHSQLEKVGAELPASETTESIFGVGTRDTLLQLQEKYNLAHTGVFDDATRNTLGIIVGNVTHPNRVEGRIFLENGLPASKIKLRIVDKGFGDDEAILGEIETDERGFYALSYGMGGAIANLEVRTFDTQNNEVRLSNPKVNADRSELINLVAPAKVKSEASEFSLLASDLSEIVGADLSKLAQAKESEDKQDVSMLHQRTDWDARLITNAAISAQLSAATGISHDALYGVIRAGLPHDLEALALVSPDAFATTLTRANKAGIIALDNEKINAAKSAFEKFAFEKRGTMIVPGTLSSVRDMVGKASINHVQRETFEKLVLKHEDNNDALWEEAKTLALPIDSLQLQGKLAYLTMNNAELTKMLLDEIRSQDNLVQLVELDLYKYQVWVNRIKNLAVEDGDVNIEKLASLIPTAYTYEEVDARLIVYADDLARKVRETFPTHVVGRMIEKNELTLGKKHDVLKEPVQTFLKKAVVKGFRLGSTPVVQFLKQHSESVFEGIDEDKKQYAKEGVKLLTRVYQMTPNDENMATLLELNFTSARQVASIPKYEFVNRYWKKFGARTATEAIWDKSVQITSTTFNIQSLVKKIDSTPPMTAVSGNPERHKEDKEKLMSLLKEYPTMESLFGSLDFCECEHCRSVLSPAAYLVDLFRFIDPPEQEWEHKMKFWKDNHNGKEYTKDYNYLKPYDSLMERRPDLPNLKLTCENTNTALPYIDLVNEIFEYVVANTQLDESAVRDTGDVSSAELMAEPHNMNTEDYKKAYDKLKNACYPFALPFDLWLETVRRFCEYFEMPFWKLLDTFRPSDDLFAPAVSPETYYRAHIFAEYFGLSPKEYAIYAEPVIADWPKLYGYDKPSDTEATTLTVLKSAKTLARRLDVTYKELAELMMTGFINPKLYTLATLRKLDIELIDVFRYKKHPDYKPLPTDEEAEMEKRLAQLTKQFQPHFDAKQWLNESWDQHQFENILVLRDPETGGNFDSTTICYADRPHANVEVIDYVKLNFLVRLWKKSKWTLEETDLALQTFCLLPADSAMSDIAIGNSIKTALIYMAHLKELVELLNMGKDGRIKLLTLWSDLPTRGENPLYAQLFLTRTILKDDAVFDDPLGKYFNNTNEFIKNHLPALQAALNLTFDEIVQILQDANKGDESDVNKAKLSLVNVSMLYRYGLLAKALKISIGEMIVLKALSGLNPFHPLNPNPLSNESEDFPLIHTLEFVRHVQKVKASTFASTDLDYLFRHRFNPPGKYKEDYNAILSWFRTLAAELRIIAGNYAVPDNANSLSDDELRQKMEMVFASDVVEIFMAYWQDKPDFSVFSPEFKKFFINHFDGLLVYDEFFGDDIAISREEKRLNLLKKMLPFIQAKLTRKTILKTMTAQTGSDEALIEALLMNRNFLALPDASTKPLLTWFEELGQLGMTTEFTPSDSNAQPIQKSVEVEESENRKQAKWRGLIEVPLDGVYRFYAKLGKKDAEVNLCFDTSVEPVLKGKAASAGDERGGSIKLKSGVLYAFILEASNLQNGTFELLIKGETTPKATISQFVVIPQSIANGAMHAYKMLHKALQLAQGLGLSERDVRHILSNPKDFGGVDWRMLPTQQTNESESAKALFNGLISLLGYGVLKRDMAGGRDDLIDIFEHAVMTSPEDVPDLCERIAMMTRRKKDDVLAAAAELKMTEPRHFSDESRMERLWHALQIMEKFGLPMTILKKWLTPKPNHAIAMDVRNAIKSHYESDTWQRIAKAIFDPLRKHQRDALVAHIMHINEELGLDSVEKLFEYFLIDPGTEPVVETSRLRLAISSLQTFIQRCFLSLEKQVHPSVLNKEHWSWMKRYRVWEANRKIFLFPENWLEPEWRDDKTHLFQELESSLLQGDVTNQLAEDALYVYLNKLEQLARLEIVTMYAEEKDGPPTMHVIGRTYSKPHQYFYRRYVSRMWTPWEPVTAEIEGDHIAAVMWRGRLHLFWITFMETGEEEKDGGTIEQEKYLETNMKGIGNVKIPLHVGGSKNTEKVTLASGFNEVVTAASSASKSIAKRYLNIQLNWSEYFQGTWTARESSGFKRSIQLNSTFDPSTVFTSVTKEKGEESGIDGAVWIHLKNSILSYSFVVISKNSDLQSSNYSTIPDSPYFQNKYTEYNRFKGAGALSVTFVQNIETTDGVIKVESPAPHPILSNGGSYILLPTSNQMQFPNEEFAPLISPFFYADDLYTFFVEPSITETTMDKWQGYTIPRPSQKSKWDSILKNPPREFIPLIPPKYYQESFRVKDVIPQPDHIDRSALYVIKGNTDALTQPGISVQFGDALIGPTGRVQNINDITNVITSVSGGIHLNHKGANLL